MAAIDFVLTGEEYWNIQQQLNHPEQLTDTELADLHGRFDEINGYSAPAKAAQLMAVWVLWNIKTNSWFRVSLVDGECV